MVKYLIFLFLLIFLGCEINSQQLVKPEKFVNEKLIFNSVSKNLNFDNSDEGSEVDIMKEITKYWFDNKVKTNGFSGSLDVNVKKIDITKLKENELFKITINLIIEFKEVSQDLNKEKIYKVNVSEFGQMTRKLLP